ncbi:MAG: site-2 protease family protein, partial [Alphaproteobacteria bacterium]|nr:site-2 protease family protein [Alphaproteobacteria bacterium]
MDILQATGLTYLLPFLFIITVVVFFHELGHFWVARKCGVRVEVFSIGFGRPLFSWMDKRNTMWKIGWLPLGGYVKFFGDESAASNPDNQKLKAM